MEFVDVAAARGMDGLRVALVRGVPSPWGMAAKAMFEHHNIPFVIVEQKGGEPNAELVDWTRHRNGPVVMYNDEAPRVRWHEIMTLAERIGSGPSLIPDNIDDRMRMVGIISELADEGGLLWQARMGMLAAGHKAQGDAVLQTPMFKEYGYSPEAFEKSRERIKDIIVMMATQAAAQKAAGSNYLVGDTLTAADIYWAFFSQPFKISPPDINPMEDPMRSVWAASGKAFEDMDQTMFELRDFTFANHIKTPMEF